MPIPPLAKAVVTFHATNVGFGLQRCLLAVVFCGAWTHETIRAGDLQPRPAMENAIGPFVEAYCIDCHRGDEAEAGINFDQLLAAPSVAHRRLQWRRAVERMTAGEMPPEDAVQPEPAEREAALAWLRAELADPDCSQPQNPGRVTLRRLNRTEYQNTIRDLTGVEFDAASIFPRDELGFGFDNNGDVLSMPPALLEKYLQAAEAIAKKAIVTPESIVEPAQHFSGGELHGGDAADRGTRALFTNGRMWAEIMLDAPGEYIVRVTAFATQAGDEPTKMRLFAGADDLSVVDVTAERRDDLQTYVARFQGEPGLELIGVDLINDSWQPWAKNPQRRDRNLFVKSLTVVGPIDALAAEKLPESHRRLLMWTPPVAQWQNSSDESWREPTRGLLSRWLTRAYRRLPSTDEIDRHLELVAQARQRGDSFERSMQLALQATLASPQFLFLGASSIADNDVDHPTKDDSTNYRSLDPYELATRLSYFLWSSTPDDQLLAAAAEGRLPGELDAHVSRLLSSSRADQLIRNFSEQWLETRRLETMQRSQRHFPEFDDELREAFRQETFLLMEDIVRRDRPLSTLLTADYSFINGRLAKHYGLSEPTGGEFVQVELPPERRAGILAHGSVLSITAFEDRTSPVLRGKWILEHLLADPPPPPPPNAGALPEASGQLAGKSLRERMEIHRADPTCASCHKRMDPLGLAMENFDAVGRWREFEGDQRIDATGELPDGRMIDGPNGLRDALLADFQRIRRSLAERLLIYALGRGLEPYDTCAVNEIVAATEAGGDTFAAMVRAVAKSAPFMQQNDGAP